MDASSSDVEAGKIIQTEDKGYVIIDGNYVVAGATESWNNDETILDGDVSFYNGGSDTWVLNYYQGKTSVNLFLEYKAAKNPKYGRGTTSGLK